MNGFALWIIIGSAILALTIANPAYISEIDPNNNVPLEASAPSDRTERNKRFIGGFGGIGIGVGIGGGFGGGGFGGGYPGYYGGGYPGFYGGGGGYPGNDTKIGPKNFKLCWKKFWLNFKILYFSSGYAGYGGYPGYGYGGQYGGYQHHHRYGYGSYGGFYG
jgi:hypothetical protein